MTKTWQKEIDKYESRTPKSKELWQQAEKVMPMGTASNARWYAPYPMFVRVANGSHLMDVDGNEYIDHNLSFGALLAGHCHPTVTEAVRRQMSCGTMYGMCHDLEHKVAEEIIKRYPFVEKVRFANTGTEATLHAIRLAKAFTGRDAIVKMEGAYHGLHDQVMISVKPDEKEWGASHRPARVAFGAGVNEAEQNTFVAQFNDLVSLQLAMADPFNKVAAVIIEPVMMNCGVILPEKNYLQGVRELCWQRGALLIVDEVKSGGMGYGGATEEYLLSPDIVCLSKSIGGGFPLAAFGASTEIMKVITNRKMFHAGTYNANPIGMAAGLATLREVLTKEAYTKARELNKKLSIGYKNILEGAGIKGAVTSVGVNGAVTFGVEKVSNYREWSKINTDVWEHYWFGMVNRGIIPQPYWWDEEWTVSVAHTEADIDKHLVALAELAPELAEKAEAQSV
jgi:glutamate-1-semialdehyde 2,1-aminomutase